MLTVRLCRIIGPVSSSACTASYCGVLFVVVLLWSGLLFLRIWEHPRIHDVRDVALVRTDRRRRRVLNRWGSVVMLLEVGVGLDSWVEDIRNIALMRTDGGGRWARARLGVSLACVQTRSRRSTGAHESSVAAVMVLRVGLHILSS